MLAAMKKASRKKVRQNRPLFIQLSLLGEEEGMRSLWRRYGIPCMKVCRSARLAFRDENITEAPHGLDVQRCRGIGFDQFAQARDLHVQAAIENFVFAT